MKSFLLSNSLKIHCLVNLPLEGVGGEVLKISELQSLRNLN